MTGVASAETRCAADEQMLAARTNSREQRLVAHSGTIDLLALGQSRHCELHVIGRRDAAAREMSAPAPLVATDTGAFDPAPARAKAQARHGVRATNADPFGVVGCFASHAFAASRTP